MQKILKSVALYLFLVISAFGGELDQYRDTETGWDVYILSQGSTAAKLVPEAGANVMSIVHRGVEYLHQPEKLSELPGVRYGTPILYPTPNRIKNGRFEFQGQQYVFRDSPGNHIHGLVKDAKFHVQSISLTQDKVSVIAAVDFNQQSERGRRFPWHHTFRIQVTVSDGKVRWDYEVDNHGGDRQLPYGVALHPYIRYLGPRVDSFLQVPAKALMESNRQLPTGELLDLDGHPLDARRPVSLSGYQSDDVFYGMQPESPTKIDFRGVGRSIKFRGSPEFTHLVVWTPDSPFLGIENQTCSTDAHNLANQGKNAVAHLQVCPPKETRSGWVQYEFD